MATPSPLQIISHIQVAIEVRFADDAAAGADTDPILSRIHGHMTNLALVLQGWQPKPVEKPKPPKRAAFDARAKAEKPKTKTFTKSRSPVSNQDALSIECPTCHSAPGDLCVVLTRKGERTSTTLGHSHGIHDKRRKAFWEMQTDAFLKATSEADPSGVRAPEPSETP